MSLFLISVSFYGESYIHIPYYEDLGTTDLELQFKASRPYGVLVLMLGSYDYLLLQLNAGTIQLKVIPAENNIHTLICFSLILLGFV